MCTVFHSNFAAQIMCRHYRPCEFLGFVWTDCWGDKSNYVITSPANRHQQNVLGKKKKKLFDLTFEPFYCQVSYHAPRPTKNFATLDQWHTRPVNNINGFLKISTITYCYHFYYTDEWKKCFYFSVSWKQTTIIRLRQFVHIAFCTVTYRYLWMLTSYVTGGCCHISVVSECYGSPLTLQ